MKEQILKALKELRKEKERKFDQSVDLIINLKNFDLKKESLNIFVQLPHKIKDVKVAGFLNKKNDIVDVILKDDFEKYKEKKDIKKLVKKYDFFLAHASLMPAVATSFGRYLGPAEKMPSPQLGILTDESEDSIKKTLENFSKILKIKAKEPSIKLCVGKVKMKDEDIFENINEIYKRIINALPKKEENIKNIMIKFTMTKPIKINFGKGDKTENE
jgi:large subunit ribosomal protein L1